MSVETLNLIKAKAVAGDVRWLRQGISEHLRFTQERIVTRALSWLFIETGFSSLTKFELAASKDQKIGIYQRLLSKLISRDFDTESPPEPPQVNPAVKVEVTLKNAPDGQHGGKTEALTGDRVAEYLWELLKRPGVVAKVDVKVEISC